MIKNIGITNSFTASLTETAPRSLLTDVNAPYGISLTKINQSISSLTKFETKCLMVQIAYMESKNDPLLVNETKYGRYQLTDFLLQKYGYKTASGDWTGLDGVDALDIFLGSIKIQDKIMQQFLEDSYKKLITATALQSGDTKDIVAGILAVSYQFHDIDDPTVAQKIKTADNILPLIKDELKNSYSVIKVAQWRNDGMQVDSLGRPAGLYFNAGKYAIQNLAADIAVT